MKNFKRIMAVVMVFAMLFLAACGGGGANNNTADVDKEITIISFNNITSIKTINNYYVIFITIAFA